MSNSVAPWLVHARAFERMMIRELPGIPAHPLIAAFFQFTQLAGTAAGESDETPWCSAFACACMELAGIPSTKHALARSWLNWGVPLSEPKEGCVLVFEKLDHVAFCNGDLTAGTHVWTLGGNQQNQVCSRLYDVQRIIGIRWPNG